MIIRKAKPDDVEEIHSIIKHFHEKLFCFIYKDRNKITSDIHSIWVIEINKKIVGCGKIEIKPGRDYGELQSLCIYEKFQGKRIGSAFLKKLLNNSDVDRIFAGTIPPTRAFFEKNGFVYLGTLNEIIRREKQTDFYEEVILYPQVCNRLPGDHCPGILLEYNKKNL